MYLQPYTLGLPLLSRRLLLACLCLAVTLSYLPALFVSIGPAGRESALRGSWRRGITLGTPVIDPNDGLTTESLGKLSADLWLHGQVPWWNPYSGIGLPLAAEMQSGSFFLPFTLLLHFPGAVVLLRLCLQLLSGVLTYLLLERLGVASTAAFAGALLYAWNGTFAWFQHSSIFPLPFLPLLLLGIEFTTREERRSRRWGPVLIAVAVAFSLYSGFPQTAYLNGILGVVWILARMVRVQASRRLAVLLRCAGAALCGLGLSAPLLLPFFEYLQRSAVQHNHFSGAALPPSGLLPLLLPYIYGPLEAFNGLVDKPDLLLDWGNIGGYLGLAVTILALAALCRRDHERTLRLSLGVFAVLVLARSIGALGTLHLFRLVPGNDMLAVFRYGTPASEMAVAILAALAINDWQTGAMRRRTVLAASVLSFALITIAIYLARDVLAPLASHGRIYWPWLASSLLVAGLMLLGVPHLFWRTPSVRRQSLLLALVAGEAAILFTVPMLAGARRLEVDQAPIEFLRAHLGLQRFFTTGPIVPNYNSYFQIASINHASLPIDKAWIEYLKANFDPALDAPTFSGAWPPPMLDREEMLRQHLPTLQDLGVRYVVTQRGEQALSRKQILPHAPEGKTQKRLQAGSSLEGELDGSSIQGGSVETIGTVLTTTAGKARGRLTVQLCRQQSCSQGSASLVGATDNASFYVELSPPLRVQPHETLRYKISYNSTDFPVTILLWPASGQLLVPEVTLGYQLEVNRPVRVFRDAVADIFEVPGTRPYFEADSGTCGLQPLSRESVRTRCEQPATLVRRELAYPGWSATLDTKTRLDLKAQGIFQTVLLPRGEHTIRFRYSPTHLPEALGTALAAGVGLLVLVLL